MTGFEPATPTSRTWCATGLRYIPKFKKINLCDVLLSRVTERTPPRCSKLFTYQSCEIFYGSHQLAYITHFVVVPANGFNELIVANG